MTLQRLMRVGVRGPWELSLTLHSFLPEVHPEDKSIAGNATALNQLLADRLGRGAMLSSEMLQRLMRLVTVESGDGSSGLLFTAPHGIWVQRDGHEHHKPEVYTTFLAVAMAQETASSYAVWSATERCKSDIRSGPDAANTDPNYAAEPQLSELPWHRILARHVRRFRTAQRSGGTGGGEGKGGGFVGQLHVDIHGRRDAIACKDGQLDVSDCDIGVGAMLNMQVSPSDADKAAAQRLASRLFASLTEAFQGTDFVATEHPRLCGWKAHRHVSLILPHLPHAEARCLLYPTCPASICQVACGPGLAAPYLLLAVNRAAEASCVRLSSAQAGGVAREAGTVGTDTLACACS